MRLYSLRIPRIGHARSASRRRATSTALLGATLGAAARAATFVKVRDDAMEVVSDRIEAEIFDSSLGNDDDVYRSREEPGLGAEGLSNPPLDFVSADSVAHLP